MVVKLHWIGCNCYRNSLEFQLYACPWPGVGFTPGLSEKNAKPSWCNRRNPAFTPKDAFAARTRWRLSFAARQIKFCGASNFWRASKVEIFQLEQHLTRRKIRERALRPCPAAGTGMPRRKSDFDAPQIKFCCPFSRQQMLRQQSSNASLHSLWMGSRRASTFCIFWCERRG